MNDFTTDADSGRDLTGPIRSVRPLSEIHPRCGVRL